MGKELREFVIKTLLPVLLTAGVGYMEVQARKEAEFAILDNYRAYIESNIQDSENREGCN